MHKLNWAIRRLAVLMLLLSLGSAPVVDMLTHGPGTLAAQADHGACHAEKGEDLQANIHPHQDSTDHDHAVSIILACSEGEIFGLRTDAKLCDLPVLSGAIWDGPRRPPRETV